MIQHYIVLIGIEYWTTQRKKSKSRVLRITIKQVAKT